MKDKQATILIVDDAELNIDIMVGFLGSKYDILVATDGETAVEITKNEHIDIILLDIVMPNLNGYEVCKILKESEETKDIPVIFITSKSDEQSIDQAYKIGGIDYISKPIRPIELLARVQTHLKLKKTIADLNYMATHDSMTNLYNRGKFFKLAYQKFQQQDENLFVIMIDIDKFKEVNDNYGHLFGDKVIKLVAKTIKDALCENAHAGRLGGEEFAIMANYDSLIHATKCIEDIRSDIEDIDLKTDDGEIVNFTISAGYARYSKDMKNLDAFVNEADMALYGAKGGGRNRIVYRR